MPSWKEEKIKVKGGHSVVGPTSPELKTTMGSYSNHKGGNIENSKEEEEEEEQWPNGLENVGNTCYANAALQCLLSTALTNALIDPKIVRIFRRYSSNPNLLAKGSGSGDSEDYDESAEPARIKTSPKKETDEARKEREKKEMQENCDWLTRELTHLTNEYLTPNDTDNSTTSYFGWLTSKPPYTIVDPGRVTRHPDRLSKCLKPYQQEDAHEFLRSLLSTLVMNGQNKQLSSLFDGLLESAVICQTCGNQSLTRDRYMDLSLDISDRDITTLEEALYNFTKAEILEEENAVFCSKCDQKQSVSKGLRLATAPSILVCHLKRFAFNEFGTLQRLHKKIQFPKRLQIADYMSQLNKAIPPPYDLVGILVHEGQTCASGHYLAYVKKNGNWYKCNDSVTTKIDEETALDQQAYILMYEVAEMRAKECPDSLTSKKKRRDVDESFETTETSSAVVEQQSSGLWRYLFDSNSGSFFDEICCDPQSASEPRKPRRRSRRYRRRNSEGSVDTFLIESEVEGRSGIRSSTAPRQRGHLGGVSSEYIAGSPARSEGAKRSPKKSRKKKNRSRSSSRRIAGKNGRELPPLPSHRGEGRRRRAKSNGSFRFKGGYVV